ncbi:hypothetical protein CI102_5723 [Trichoderma harzianum]|nr:hypothetical protein CI102_5723 [Trichoderma harzianum]
MGLSIAPPFGTVLYGVLVSSSVSLSVCVWIRNQNPKKKGGLDKVETGVCFCGNCAQAYKQGNARTCAYATWHWQLRTEAASQKQHSTTSFITSDVKLLCLVSMDINCTSTGTATTKQPRVPDKGPNIAAVLLSARTASYKYMSQ